MKKNCHQHSTWTSLIGSFVHLVGVDGVKGVDGVRGGSIFQPATSFTILEYMIIWSKIP